MAVAIRPIRTEAWGYFREALLKTAFHLLILRCGLSQGESAAFLNVDVETIEAWCSGAHIPPATTLAALQSLYAKIDRQAQLLIDAIRLQAPLEAQIDIHLAATEAEALSLGWPCVGAAEASIGLCIAKSDRRIVIKQPASANGTG